MKVLTKFLLSAYAPEQFPPAELPEIAFLGRSNVGKSSLINSLVSAKIAKTSNTPGRTQAINFFEIRWPGRPRPELIFALLSALPSASASAWWTPIFRPSPRIRI
jgi:GTP-binding protein